MMADLKVFEKFSLQLRSQDLEESKETDSPMIDHLLSQQNPMVSLDIPLIDGKSTLIETEKY